MPAIFISHASEDSTVAAQVMQWLAERGHDRVFLDFDKARGIVAGEAWERRLYEEISRCHAVILIVTEGWLRSKWCFAEFAQARALGKVILPLVEPPADPAVVAPELANIQFETWTDAGRDHLDRRLKALTHEIARGYAWTGDRAPYPGILSFDGEDAAVFFGRDPEIREIAERIEARRVQGGPNFLMIVGASGSGKSSLLKAGVLPYLARDRANWITLPPFRPEQDPLTSLAKAASERQGRPADWRSLRNRLAADAGGVAELVEELRVGAARNATVLIAIDQFEETFTQSLPERRAGFLACLSASAALPVQIVATVRSDLLGEILRAGEFDLAFQDYALRPMPLDRLPLIVQGPASVAAITLEEGLADRIARDVTTPEALPLLAFALRELYERHGRGRHGIALRDYDALGDPAAGLNPLENAIRRKAEQVLADLAPDAAARAALREAFVGHLVRISEEGRFVRRSAPLRELPDAARPLIESLVAARLLSIRREDDEALVEVAHEALFRAWPELGAWLEEERDFLTGLRRIEDAERAWSAAREGERGEALLTGLLLTRARHWHAAHPARFSHVERYLAESFARDDAERARTERRRRLAVVASLAAAAMFAVLAVLAWQAEQRAVAQAERAERNFAAAVAAVDGLIDDIVQGLRDVEGIRASTLDHVLGRVAATIDRLAGETTVPDALDAQRSAMLGEFARTYLRFGEVERALASAEDSVEIARAVHARAPEDDDARWLLSVRLEIVGDARMAAGRVDSAGDAFAESLDIRRALAAMEPGHETWRWGVGLGLVRLGDFRRREGRLEEARAAYEEGLALRRALLAEDPDNLRYQRDVALMIERLGRLAVDTGTTADALALQEEALALRRAVAEAEPGNTEWQRDVGVGLLNIGDLRRRVGDSAGAIAAYEEALPLRRRLVELDPGNLQWQGDVGEVLERLGDAHWLAGDLESAREAYAANLEVWRALAEAHPDNPVWQRNVALALIRLGDLAVTEGAGDTASALHAEALAIYRRLVALDPDNVVWLRDLTVALNRQGDAALRDSDPAAAVEAYRESLDIRRGLAARDPSMTQWQQDVAFALTRLGAAHRAAGDTAAARAAYEECTAIAEALLGLDPAVAGWVGDLAECLLGLAELAEGTAREALIDRVVVLIDGFAAAGPLPDRLERLRAEAGPTPDEVE